LRVALADASPVVRQLAVAALWEDERDDLPDLLRGVLATDRSQDVRAEAARVLGRFAILAAAGEREEALAEDIREDLAAVVGDAAQPYTVRRRALESLGVFGQQPAIRQLIRDAYESGDQGMQASALYAMGESLDAAWLPTLLEELASEEAELRFEAARACGALGKETPVAELAECAADEDPEVRQAAIAALGQIGGRGAIRVLRALAEQAEQSDETERTDEMDGADEADRAAIAAALEEAASIEDPFGAGGA
ncbi:MAG: HEAT repeat domain-containing protein, partial [Thermomicrobiales bacterium]|nr:HEAT repeat domain-containing protein [Thermomicrobiales bacterium]